MSDFYQIGPELGNQYLEDSVLRNFLRRILSEEAAQAFLPHFEHLGHLVAHKIWSWARDAEDHPPQLRSFNAWGKRIDQIETARGWQKLKRFAAEKGIIATAYERRFGHHSRLCQSVLLYLFHPSSAVYSCPLAMTDGAARVLELHGDADLKRRAMIRLISRDPDHFWTSGQWMTERMGGSDVGRTATIARVESNHYRLYGTKWFTSAATSEMALTLARIDSSIAGSQGLSLFYLETRAEDGSLDQIELHRLKDKLGTRALPTAELTMHGTKAKLIGTPGHGVRHIASLLNITRIYNSICAVASMRRGLALARDYALKREAFGRKLSEHPLHVRTLARLDVRFRGSFHLVFHLVTLLGKEETQTASDSEKAILRIMTPIAKLFSAKEAIAVSSEVLECFGGAGYIEDTHLPELLRNSQVLSIWEGTTNILSLDFLRALGKSEGFPFLYEDLRYRLLRIIHPSLVDTADRVSEKLNHLHEFSQRLADLPLGSAELLGRDFAFFTAWVFAAALLLEQAQWQASRPDGSTAIYAAKAWCEDVPPNLGGYSLDDLTACRALGLGQNPDEGE